MIAYNLIWVNGLTKRNTSVVSPIICRSALAIEAHRGVASLANTARYGQAIRLALRSHGCAQPTTYDRGRDARFFASFPRGGNSPCGLRQSIQRRGGGFEAAVRTGSDELPRPTARVEGIAEYRLEPRSRMQLRRRIQDEAEGHGERIGLQRPCRRGAGIVPQVGSYLSERSLPHGSGARRSADRPWKKGHHQWIPALPKPDGCAAQTDGSTSIRRDQRGRPVVAFLLPRGKRRHRCHQIPG